MNGYTHMVIGGLCGGLPVAFSIAGRTLGFPVAEHTVYPFIGVLPAVIGALGPDIDMPNSKGGRRVRSFLKAAVALSGAAVLALSLYICFAEKAGRLIDALIPCAVFFGLCCCLSLFIAKAKHRRETHSGLVLGILLLPFFYMIRFTAATVFTNALLSVWAGFCIGWFSHLAADTFNQKGVPWLYPLSKKHFHISKFVTGTAGEGLFRTFCIVLFVTVYIILISRSFL
ncbi:MAG: metal-dependent hydrolase [Spirochaetaceae bacterium]|jgi:membrane-bound metal-dependent hydrolase YbcI (DUF457 family)|nr:metal-dependent hydrolase [Spirochaetaceae bacterium]